MACDAVKFGSWQIDNNVSEESATSLKMEAAYSSETSVPVYYYMASNHGRQYP
jgi:hypothetical protein